MEIIIKIFIFSVFLVAVVAMFIAPAVLEKWKKN